MTKQTSILKIHKFKNKVGIDKSTETRNDGITMRKSLLWHLTIYNMPL